MSAGLPTIQSWPEYPHIFYICIYVCIHIYVYLYIWIFLYMYICILVYMYVLYICISVYMYMCICAYMYICSGICIYHVLLYTNHIMYISYTYQSNYSKPYLFPHLYLALVFRLEAIALTFASRLTAACRLAKQLTPWKHRKIMI